MKIWPILIFLYFISPIDILPDYIRPYGWLDDLLLIMIFAGSKNKFVKHIIKQIFLKHRQKQKQFKSTDRGSNEEQDYPKQQKDFNPWQVLEISPGSSSIKVKKAYKQKCQEYHPDKVANLGIKLQNQAEKEFKDIQKAWNMLKE